MFINTLNKSGIQLISTEAARTGRGWSVSLFLRPSVMRDCKKMSRHCNDVRWVGPIRITNTK